MANGHAPGGDVYRRVLLPKLSEIGPLRPSGAGYTACCPAHEDRTPSLSVGEGADQPVVIHCQAGCASDDVLAALGLSWADLSNPDGGAARGGSPGRPGRRDVPVPG
jgi:rhodanese-related sulfurtransferase